MLKLDLILQVLNQIEHYQQKTYSYLIDDDSEDKKAKGTKKCVIKNTLNLRTIKTVQKQLNFKMK